MLKYGTIQLAYLRQPLLLPTSDTAYVLWLVDGTRFQSVFEPDIFDSDENPTKLVAELAPGSEVIVNADGNILRAVQIIRHAIASPFSNTSNRSQRVREKTQSILAAPGATIDWKMLLLGYQFAGVAYDGLALGLAFRKPGSRSLPTVIRQQVPPWALADAARRSKMALEEFRRSQSS